MVGMTVISAPIQSQTFPVSCPVPPSSPPSSYQSQNTLPPHGGGTYHQLFFQHPHPVLDPAATGTSSSLGAADMPYMLMTSGAGGTNGAGLGRNVP